MAAPYISREGLFRLGGASALGRIRSISISNTKNPIEVSSQDDANKVYKVGQGDGSGSATMVYDQDDTGYAALLVAFNARTPIQAEYFPSGEVTAAEEVFDGTVVLSESAVDSPEDGAITVTCSWTGAMPEGVVSA